MLEEAKRGAGQYFTPRDLIDVIVDLLKPRRVRLCKIRPPGPADLS